ncbi:MAG: M48 family metallopeptidase, partial [Acidobacteriota bacterium]
PGFAAALHAAAPPLRPPRASRRLGRMLAAIAAAFAAIGGIWWSLPALSVLMVALIPVDAEERLGDRGLASLPLVACKNDAGQAALDGLVRRLTEHTEMRLRPKAIAGQFDMRGGDKMVNAFALPGGRIVVLRGLIDEAESADELAGILGHELTHAIKRHGLRRLFAQAGFGILFQTILGYGYTSDTGEFFASLSFTRAEEREADAGGIELLKQAGISTAGFAAFFKRLAAHVQGEAPALLQNHPATAERIATVEAAASAATSPALSPEDWNALKHICESTPRYGDAKQDGDE